MERMRYNIYDFKDTLLAIWCLLWLFVSGTVLILIRIIILCSSVVFFQCDSTSKLYWRKTRGWILFWTHHTSQFRSQFRRPLGTRHFIFPAVSRCHFSHAPILCRSWISRCWLGNASNAYDWKGTKSNVSRARTQKAFSWSLSTSRDQEDWLCLWCLQTSTDFQWMERG